MVWIHYVRCHCGAQVRVVSGEGELKCAVGCMAPGEMDGWCPFVWKAVGAKVFWTNGLSGWIEVVQTAEG
jgi:hypothetical protein